MASIDTSHRRRNCHICALGVRIRHRQPTTAKVRQSDGLVPWRVFRLIPSAAQRFGQGGSAGHQLVALSPRVDRNEAKLLADCAYATVSQLRRHYRMFGTPIFNNFLIYHGLRQRDYCYQWSEDLLVALDALKLTSLELRWGESNPGNWRENNCIVVTAKGRPFRSGIMLDCWRQLGHLYFRPVVADSDPYVENRAYARFVLARSGARNVSGANHRVAFQMSAKASGKTGD
jgi:hypothetical protein